MHNNIYISASYNYFLILVLPFFNTFLLEQFQILFEIYKQTASLLEKHNQRKKKKYIWGEKKSASIFLIVLVDSQVKKKKKVLFV